MMSELTMENNFYILSLAHAVSLSSLFVSHFPSSSRPSHFPLILFVFLCLLCLLYFEINFNNLSLHLLNRRKNWNKVFYMDLCLRQNESKSAGKNLWGGGGNRQEQILKMDSGIEEAVVHQVTDWLIDPNLGQWVAQNLYSKKNSVFCRWILHQCLLLYPFSEFWNRWPFSINH